MNTLVISIALLVAFCSMSHCVFDPILPLESCISDTDCASKFPDSYCDFDRKVDCDVGVCMCKTDLVPVPLDPFNNPNNISCLPRTSDIGDTCTHDNQCIESFGELSACMKNGTMSTCECSQASVFCDGASLKVKECVRPRLKLGDPCSGCDSQCSIIPGAVCSADATNEDPWRCRCKSGYVAADDNSKCAPSPSTVGGNCNELWERQCSQVKGTICDLGTMTCQCNNETHVQSGDGQHCLLKRNILGMPCSEDAQCLLVRNACVSERCSCTASSVQSQVFQHLCVPISDHGEQCDEDIQCTETIGKNSECSGREIGMTCECKHGHIYHGIMDSEYVRCFPLTPLGGSCRSYRQCVDATGSSEFTTCHIDRGTEGVCKCADYTYVKKKDGICYEQTYITGQCRKDDECKLWITGPVLCDKVTSKCVCDAGYEASFNNLECHLKHY